MYANEMLGYPAIHSHKVTVGLIKGHSWIGPIRKIEAPFDVTKTTLGKFHQGTREKPLPLRAAIDAYKALKEEK